MRYVKNFMLRGLLFGGLGPIVFGVICVFASRESKVNLTGTEVCISILSTYILAFVQAGTSVYKDVEKWSMVKASGLQLLTLYVVYKMCYLINSWIPFEWYVILIYTISFVITYFVIWLVVYIVVKKSTKELNEKLK